MIETPQRNTVIKGRIKRLMLFSLLVTLPGGGTGIVREREISWDVRARARWREQFATGQEIEVLVLGHDDENNLQLSIRLAQADPWKELSAKYRPGDWVAGRVTGTTRHGVFIALEPGVDGLLRESELPAWFNQPFEQWFWYGDPVHVMIKDVHPAQRKLDLSMREIRDVRWRSSTVTGANPAQAKPEAPPLRLPLELTSLQRAYTLLIVENDPEQREIVRAWLTNAGQHVLEAHSAEEGLATLATEPVDFVLMDVHLPEMDGISAMTEAQRIAPHVRIILMTDWAAAGQLATRLERAQASGAKLLSKPFDPEILLPILLEESATLGREPESASTPTPSEPPPIAIASMPPHRALSNTLARMRRVTTASAAVLFELDPAERKIHITAHIGADAARKEALLELIYSPVRDVAEDRQFVSIEDASLATGKLRYLRPWMKFGACLGLPLASDLASHYALFLFFDQPTQLSGTTTELARAAAMQLSTALERRELLDRSTAIQRKALLGDLSWGLVHELNQRIMPTTQAIAPLQQQIEKAVHALPTSPERAIDQLHMAQRSLAHLANGVRAMAKTTETFKQITVQSQESIVRIEAEVRAAADLARDMADRAGVAIDIELPEHMVVTRAHAAQIQHVLLNTLINAIQQINGLRPKQKGKEGRVVIRFQQRRHKTGESVVISIEDDGPGIHTRNIERVFGLGFTTRPNEGSGLGLYIAKQIMEGMDGRIFVAESAMLWGTKFVIELPLTTDVSVYSANELENGGEHDPGIDRR